MYKSVSRQLGAFLNHLGLREKRCSLCLEPFTEEISQSSIFPSSLLCSACSQDLVPINGPLCSVCGIPISTKMHEKDKQNNKSLCEACKQDLPPWSQVAYYGLYNGKLRDAVLALKYSGTLHLAALFSDLLYEASKCLPSPDLLVPVPLSEERLKKRGFNQALEIGKLLAAKSAFDLNISSLRRIKNIPPQEELSANERKWNVKDAFQASSDVKGASIWLLDDVMTTGSTLTECSRTLLNAGAKNISVLFVARTSLG